MAFSDQTLQCVDCKADFLFSAGEADFYQQKGLSAPKRCKDCRAAKKAKMNGGQQRPAPQRLAPIDHQDDLGDPSF